MSDSKTTRPNILFFFTDDQRFDTIQALNNPDIKTPNIDSLVARGVSFTNSYIMGGTSGAVCMPSRAMLMSGRTLFHIGEQGQNIPDDHITMGEALKKEGYTTFGTGKWHNGCGSYARSFSDGAEIFFGGMDDHWNVPACKFDPTGRYEQRLPITYDYVLKNKTIEKTADHVTPGKHSSELFCDAAIDFLSRHDGKNPFLMYVSFMAPHDPRTMPQQFMDMYDPEKIELPPNFADRHPFELGVEGIRDERLAEHPRKPEEIKRHIAEYYAMISHLDHEMGRVLKALKESGEYDNTIIVFAGDNGLAVGKHGLMGKQNLYEHSIHVPLLISGPGLPAGKKVDAFCYLLDIYPTLCDLIGARTPRSVEGKSLVPAVKSAALKPRDSLYFAYTSLYRAVRKGNMKLIEYAVRGKRTTQLFDLEKDPNEMENLANRTEMTGTVTELRTELVKWKNMLDDDQPGFGKTFWAGFGA